MKKILTLTLAAMMTISLAACTSQKEEKGTEAVTENKVVTEKESETAAQESEVQESEAQTEQETFGAGITEADTVESEKDTETNTGADTETNTNEATEASTEADGAKVQDTITVTSLNGDGEKTEVEVPYDPQRVAILDMAVLDMLDNWELGDRVVGMPKSSQIDYLMEYNENKEITNLGTLKEVDMEALMSSEPDIIFIGGRLSAQYEALSEIAPVIYTATDYDAGLIQSIKNNSDMIASIFGMQEKAAEELAGFDQRVDALAKAAEGKTAVIGMVTSSNFNTLGNGSRCSLIGNEIGFENLADNVDSTHGNESSFELLVSLNPDYIFVLDRDSAISTEGAQLAQEVMENELVQKTDAYKEGNIVYLTPTVWYLAEGGITAMDVMLSDLEAGILGK
ncbi:siderophore ABC transporter substrate-binding protein [Murimonas intestini]|uniref:Iron complex transport system substrate-binding protein n=1 Tax=Murimonas intestini TaxID=1337051 RepID=A0AB73SXQ2_9FIRM|nr:siderophore ABC transporter substrate-binding protein [Murimonas intestini]MCR1843352.1 siderophore ABC transporter substrate-binding protein [Murimonas intestini]MCR1868726.1 siderophore ABC transporter substrate-binding protein [Murimonas intestini]MCR1886326.1 siderophore ABC transporter substrate-binding protein [Murimonas intestini]